MTSKIPIIIAVSLLLPGTALAAGLSVSPARLDFELSDGRKLSKNIIVINPTADVMIFEVYPDEFANIISVNPESFTLEAGSRKEVMITVNIKNIGESQNISTNISVVGKTLAESKINVATGAKIPITINIADAP